MGKFVEQITLEDLAKKIFSMRYEDLRDLGTALFQMTQIDDGKEIWDLSKEGEWAELLFRWAEATIEAIPEEADDGVSKD